MKEALRRERKNQSVRDAVKDVLKRAILQKPKAHCFEAVSYTHLDVYKRQEKERHIWKMYSRKLFVLKKEETMNENKRMPQEILRKDLEAIYIGNLNTVDDNLIFPETGRLSLIHICQLAIVKIVSSLQEK